MARSVPKPATALAAAFLLAAACGPAQAQQFSARLVRIDAGQTAPRKAGRINVSNGRVRLETSDIAGGFFVLPAPGDAPYFVRPSHRIFMEARQSSELTRLLVTVDPADPCPQWQAMAERAGAEEQGARWRCECAGAEAVDGRQTIRYRLLSPSGRSSSGWIESQLRFPVRVETSDGSVVDIVNIEEAQQPDSLFEIPAGYRKFDPQQLIERIKQSDVWVAPPGESVEQGKP